MFSKIKEYSEKPRLYAPSTGAFWDDTHISKQMLHNHLNPDADGASRKHEFIERSAAWICETAPPERYPKLLDLGCGPGLYARLFAGAGYTVTAVDYSKRAVDYAKSQAGAQRIDYRYENYMNMNWVEEFDIVTLIYCDYAVFSAEDRQLLAEKVYRSLKKGGKFILDVFTPVMRSDESRTWGYYPDGGFFSPEPYLSLDAVYQYENADETELRQSIIVTESGIACYNIWDHFFTPQKLIGEMTAAGFEKYELFGDVAGQEFTDDSRTICGVFTK